MKHVLKSDDDQAVDTHHLKRYLAAFVEDNTRPFLLCDLIRNNKPQRNVNDKWHVTQDEYSGDKYPPYCAGWAYATNLAYVRLVLEAVEAAEDYFWIDDVYVTGLKRPAGAAVYDWQHAFLHSHAQYRDEVFEGSFFSPELMVASDLRPEEMRRLWTKMEESERKGWASKAFYDAGQERLDMLRPEKVDLGKLEKEKDEL